MATEPSCAASVPAASERINGSLAWRRRATPGWPAAADAAAA